MRLASMDKMLNEAKNGQYAIGQFNLNSLLWAVPIMQAAEIEQSPVILGTSNRLIDYLGGFETIVQSMQALKEYHEISVPVALHLDHGESVEACFAAIDAGYQSVMIDGSRNPIKENIAITKEVTNYAKQFGVSVEAEVGTVGGSEDGLTGTVQYAKIEDCVSLVEETGINALAAALGSVHGPYQGEPNLGFEQMEEISKKVDIPLVLHGGSGIPPEQIQKAIHLGHSKINVNTECAQAWTNALKKYLMNVENQAVYEPRVITDEAMSAIKKVVQSKIQEFGSQNKV